MVNFPKEQIQKFMAYVISLRKMDFSKMIGVGWLSWGENGFTDISKQEPLSEQNERSPYENNEGGITRDAYWGNDFPKMTFFQETYFFIMMFP